MSHPPTLNGCAVLSPMATAGKKPERPAGKKLKPAGERFKTINTFCDFTLAGLDRADFAVWLLLWRDTKPDGLARTAQADLARRAGIAVRTAGRAVSSLHKAGLLSIVRRGGLSSGPSTYRVHPLGPP